MFQRFQRHKEVRPGIVPDDIMPAGKHTTTPLSACSPYFSLGFKQIWFQTLFLSQQSLFLKWHIMLKTDWFMHLKWWIYEKLHGISQPSPPTPVLLCKHTSNPNSNYSPGRESLREILFPYWGVKWTESVKGFFMPWFVKTFAASLSSVKLTMFGFFSISCLMYTM